MGVWQWLANCCASASLDVQVSRLGGAGMRGRASEKILGKLRCPYFLPQRRLSADTQPLDLPWTNCGAKTSPTTILCPPSVEKTLE